MSNLRIGFASVFFTLWEVTTETLYATTANGDHYPSGTKTNFLFYQNLSKDLATAQSKAAAAGATNLSPDEELHGRTSSWSYFKKSPEVLAMEEAGRVAMQAKVDALIAAQEKAEAVAAAKMDAFLATFEAGREFETVSNFRVYEDEKVSIAIIFDAENEFEETIQKRNAWGFNLFVPVNASDLACKDYRGCIYFTLPGWRSMKNRPAKIVDGEFIISKS
jgi:hypothetical protein